MTRPATRAAAARRAAAGQYAAAAIAAILLTTSCTGDDRTGTGPGRSSAPTAAVTPSSPAGSPQPVTPQPIPPGDTTKVPAGGAVGKVDDRNATAVAIAAVTVSNRHDTAIDNSPSDAQRRAVRWLAPPLAAQLTGGPAAAPGAEWATWTRHRAYTTAAAANATEYGAPPDTATRADRSIAVTVRPVGRDRWRGPARQTAVFVTLTRTSAAAAWKVSQFQVQE